MTLMRILKHLFVPSWVRGRAFPAETLSAIDVALGESEKWHRGEIRVVVEGTLGLGALLRNESSRERAQALFSRLRVWDTEENNGVLLYIQWLDRKVEIVADRGFATRVGQAEWDQLHHRMDYAFREGDYRGGAVMAVRELALILAAHFPAPGLNPATLPDRPILL
jgi:uncharacterized membrane protein